MHLVDPIKVHVSYIRIKHWFLHQPHLKIKVDNGREYPGHCLIIELIDGHNIEVSEEPGRDGVPASSGWTHGR